MLPVPNEHEEEPWLIKRRPLGDPNGCMEKVDMEAQALGGRYGWPKFLNLFALRSKIN